VWIVKHADGIPIWPLVSGMIGPLLACGPMAGAVYGVRWLVVEAGGNAIMSLAAELAVGGIVYIPCAFIFAPSASRDFISLIKKALRRGGADETESEGESDGESKSDSDE
jgi:hypothetical protein